MSGKIRIGIVGMGAAGWAFVPAIRGNPAFELAAIAEPDAGHARDRGGGNRRCGAIPTCRRCCGSAELDAVYIATPTELHPEHVAQVCAANKHVLTEKPMAIRVEQAQAMVDAAERAGVVLQVGHSHSYDLPIARMREIVAVGRARPRPHDPHLELHRLDGAAAPRRPSSTSGRAAASPTARARTRSTSCG